MNSGGPSNSQWKFDPSTGEPISRDPLADEPSEQPFSPFSQSERAPITGPLDPHPDLPDDIDTFRAPYQAQQPIHTHATPATPDTPSMSPEQAPYQQPYSATPPQGYSAPQPPTQPYVYPPQQPPAQPYNYSAQPPTQPAPGYPPQYGQYSTPAPQVTPRPAPPQRASRAPLILGLAAIILLAVIGGGAIFLWQNVFNRPAVSVEKLLPANTLGYFSFDPVLEGQQKAAMDKISAAFQAQPGFKEAWDKFTGQIASAISNNQTGATPDTGNLDTLASYLGNSVTVAVLAPDSADLQKIQDASGNGDMGSIASDVLGKNVAVIVDLDFNPLNKKGPISDLKQQADNAGKAELVEKYRDIDIRKFITNTTEIYFALLDSSSTAIVGAKAEPLRVLIDGYRDNKTLKDDATFKALSGQVPQERIAALYVNLTEVYKQVQLAAPELTQGQSVQNVSGSMLLTLSADNDGFQVDVASETDLSLMDTAVQVNPDARPDPATLNDIPSDAMAFYAGTDLKTTLQSVLTNLRSNGSIGSQIDQQIKSFEDSTKVNIEKDLIPLLGGDYTISFSFEGQSGTMSPTVVFQLKLSEADKMKSLLNNALSPQNNPDSTLEEASIAGGTFYGDQFTGVLIGVAQDRFWFVFGSDRQSAEARLQKTVDNLGKGFGSSAQWNSAKGHLTRDSNAIGYVDLAAVRQYVETEILDINNSGGQGDYEQNVAPFVRPLKYLLLGSATQAAKSGQLSRNHTVLFLGISK